MARSYSLLLAAGALVLGAALTAAALAGLLVWVLFAAPLAALILIARRWYRKLRERTPVVIEGEFDVVDRKAVS